MEAEQPIDQESASESGSDKIKIIRDYKEQISNIQSAFG